MNERRNSNRLAFVEKMTVREMNGDYIYTLRALNLSEEGVFLENKFCASDQEAFSKISFVLPNGQSVRNIVARIVREEKSGSRKGSAYEFMNISEDARMELKRFFTNLELSHKTSINN